MLGRGLLIMNKGEIRCFKRRDFGQFLYFGVALCLFGIGVLLLIQKDIGSADIITGLKFITLICGAGILAGFFLNTRTRFRPGWTLPLGLILTLIGVGYVFSDIFKAVKKPSVGLSVIVILISFINSCLVLSTSIQVFSLRLKRWRYYAAYAIINFTYFTMLFTNTFSLRENELVGCSIFMFILAVQLTVEGLIDLLKFEAARKRFAPEETK